jgi:hypothetical protein
MATDTELPLATDGPGESYRPALPDSGIGRRLRVFAGVWEEILDWVPEERARYTRLGMIVLNTGIMAGASLLVALENVVHILWIFLLPAALIWGYVIVSFDGWLIASTHGKLSRKWKVFAVRLLLSVLLGAFIAEPLVLWFFHPAIRTEIAHMHDDDAAGREARWVRCNPPSGGTPAGCSGFLLSLRDSPTTVQGQLTQLQSERSTLKEQLDSLNGQLSAKQDLARRECNGNKGSGLSGRAGVGPNCHEDRREAEQFRTTNRMDQKQATLVSYDGQIDRLTEQLKQQGQAYRGEIKTEIDKKMVEWRRGLGRPGLLDEVRALGRLSSRNMFVAYEQWLLRFLLVAVDCLPVLTKWLSGTTTYDVLYSRQLETDGRLHEKYLASRERKDSSFHDLRLKQADYDHHAKSEEINEAYRADRAQRETDLDDEVERLAARLRRQG